MPLHSVFLKYFEGVCRYGSIRKAAAKLHISPTAINRAILNYEDEINLRLFERSNEGMSLTVAGKILHSHISRTLDDASATLNELKEMAQGEANQIKVGGAESLISAYLPAVMLDFFKMNPNASTSFTLCTTETALTQLERSNIDVAIIFDPAYESHINIVYEQALLIGAIFLPDHPMASHNRIHIEQCAEYPIIMPEKTWSLRHKLDILFEQKKLKRNVVMESGSTEMLQSMIAEKIGVGFHTIVGIESSIENRDLVFVPLLAPRQQYQRLAVCIHPDKTPSVVMQNMIDLLIKDLKLYSGR